MTHYVTRLGRNTEATEAFFAWTSRDVDRMERAIDTQTNEIDRHFLLQSLVGELFKDRDDPASRQKLYRYAEMHLAELPRLFPIMKEDSRGQSWYITTFRHLSQCLEEDGRVEDDNALWDLIEAAGYER